MKLKHNRIDWLRRDQGETMAVFGQAKLMKHLDGRLELVGGTAADQTAAKEWISLFLHEAVPTRPA